MKRVLVTGSRGWTDHEAVWNALSDQYTHATGMVTVVHGGAVGVDSIADEWGMAMLRDGWPVRLEKHIPNYQVHGDRAPLIRNQKMVNLGADVCLAFPMEGGTGTRHCMSRCYAAGIPVINYGFQPYTYQAQEFSHAYG